MRYVLTPELLASLRALAEKAKRQAPGPWRHRKGAWVRHGIENVHGHEIACGPYEQTDALALIAALSPEVVTALVDLAEKGQHYAFMAATVAHVEAQRDQARAERDEARQKCVEAWGAHMLAVSERDSLKAIVEAAKGSHADLIDAFEHAVYDYATRASVDAQRTPLTVEQARYTLSLALAQADHTANNLAAMEASRDRLAAEVETLRTLYEHARATSEVDASLSCDRGMEVERLRSEVEGLRAERRTLCRACTDDRDNGDMHCPSCGCDL